MLKTSFWASVVSFLCFWPWNEQWKSTKSSCMAIKGLEQAVENLSRISKTAVPGAAAMAIIWIFSKAR